MRSQKLPLWIGLKAIRANLLPGLLIQALMLAVVLGYYDYPPVAAWLNRLAEMKKAYGYPFSVLSAALAGAVFPEALRVVFGQKGAVRGENLKNLLFTVPFWGFDGLSVDVFYRYQDLWFGSGVHFTTLAVKVFVDQFIFTPFYAAPLTLWAFEFRDRGYRWRGFSGVFTVDFYRSRVFPTVVAIWGVWIPLVAIIYSLPLLLQIPLFALALSFWALLVTFIVAPQPGRA